MNRFNALVHNWRSDFDFRTFMSASPSLAASLWFTAYNGFLGVWHQSLWNGSICLYYVILSVIRALIIVVEDRLH